jgi:hypothetical protein
MESQSTEEGAVKRRSADAKKREVELGVELKLGRIGELGMDLRVAEQKNSDKTAMEIY